MSTSDPVVIVSAARTPLGRFQGELSSLSGHKLGSHVIAAAVGRAKLAPERIDIAEEISAVLQPNSFCSGTMKTPGAPTAAALTSAVTKVTAIIAQP